MNGHFQSGVRRLAALKRRRTGEFEKNSLAFVKFLLIIVAGEATGLKS